MLNWEELADFNMYIFSHILGGQGGVITHWGTGPFHGAAIHIHRKEQQETQLYYF
jgi:hypothetical protein